MSDAPDPYTWLYSFSGAVTHGVRKDLSQVVAACGYSPPIGWPWLGTGGQDEYEWAAELPQCKSCLKRLGRTS